jgi:hypothetical protein
VVKAMDTDKDGTITLEERNDRAEKALSDWRHPSGPGFRAIRIAIHSGQPILVAAAPQPPIVAAFADGTLSLTLPSGRALTYPEARLIPSKFEDAPSDVQFLDNARGQWKAYRGGSALLLRTSCKRRARSARSCN